MNQNLNIGDKIIYNNEIYVILDKDYRLFNPSNKNYIGKYSSLKEAEQALDILSNYISNLFIDTISITVSLLTDLRKGLLANNNTTVISEGRFSLIEKYEERFYYIPDDDNINHLIIEAESEEDAYFKIIELQKNTDIDLGELRLHNPMIPFCIYNSPKDAILKTNYHYEEENDIKNWYKLFKDFKIEIEPGFSPFSMFGIIQLNSIKDYWRYLNITKNVNVYLKYNDMELIGFDS